MLLSILHYLVTMVTLGTKALSEAVTSTQWMVVVVRKREQRALIDQNTNPY